MRRFSTQEQEPQSDRGLRDIRGLRGFLIAGLWLLVWQTLSNLVASELLLPSPMQTTKSLLLLAQTPAFWRSTGGSLLRVLFGYLSAIFLGATLGALTAASPLADAFFRPLRGMIRATPVASLILLVMLWMKSWLAPAFMAFLMVLPLVWANVQEGIAATDEKLLEMAKLFRFSSLKKLRLIYLPSIMPPLMAACSTGLGFAWKAGVAAEVLARTANSIGKNLAESKSYLLVADMFAWTAVIILLSVALERLLLVLLRRARRNTPWEETGP